MMFPYPNIIWTRPLTLITWKQIKAINHDLDEKVCVMYHKSQPWHGLFLRHIGPFACLWQTWKRAKLGIQLQAYVIGFLCWSQLPAKRTTSIKFWKHSVERAASWSKAVPSRHHKCKPLPPQFARNVAYLHKQKLHTQACALSFRLRGTFYKRFDIFFLHFSKWKARGIKLWAPITNEIKALL